MSINIDVNHSSIKNLYRTEIDGLRAFAVLTVIINHFNKEILPGGYLGVDIFFVISGFVITSSLYSKKSKNFRDFISGFYERRIKRLVPALLVFVVIMSIAICLFNPYPETQLGTGKRALIGLSNIALYNQSIDYFAQSTKLNVFTHTWSLAVEEQFYFIFPFLVWFSGYGRQTKKGVTNLFQIVLTLAISSLIIFLYLYQKNQPAAYFLMPSRLWEMSSGCLLFLGLQKRASIGEFLGKLPSFLVLSLIFGVMYLPISFAPVSTLAVVILTSVLIASLKKNTAAYRLLTNPKVVYIGLLSYSLYLWHWGILSISRWTVGIHWWTLPFQILLMYGLAVASYQWIETPLRRGNWFMKRWKNLVFFGSSLFFTVISITILPKSAAKQFLASIGDKIYPPAYLIEPGSSIQDLYCQLPTKIETAFKDCFSNIQHKKITNKIFLIGDSHASNHHHSIISALNQTDSEYTLRTLVEDGFILYLKGQDNCSFKKICIENAGDAYKNYFKENLNDKDYIFISISRDSFTIGEFKGLARKQDFQSIKILKQRLLSLLQIIEKKNANLVLIGDIPKVCPTSMNYSLTVVRLGRIELCDTEKYVSLNDRKEMNNVFVEIAELSKNTIYIDPHNELCLEDKCRTVDRTGKLIYSDISPHFTKDSKYFLKDYWIKVFDEIGISNLSDSE